MLYCTITFFTHENGINFCKINCKLSLNTHISRIYPYKVNVYKILFKLYLKDKK